MLRTSSQLSIYQIACYYDMSHFDGDIKALCNATHEKAKNTIWLFCFDKIEHSSAFLLYSAQSNRCEKCIAATVCTYKLAGCFKLTLF